MAIGHAIKMQMTHIDIMSSYSLEIQDLCPIYPFRLLRENLKTPIITTFFLNKDAVDGHNCHNDNTSTGLQ